MTRIRTSRVGTLSCHCSGDVVWDDYLEHHQLIIRPPVDYLILRCTGWKTIDEFIGLAKSMGASESRALAWLRRLLGANVLIPEGSERATQEDRLWRRWGDWGFSAPHFHYSSRTLYRTPFSSREEDNQRLIDKERTVSPPPPFLPPVSPNQVALPPSHVLPLDQLTCSLGAALGKRRSRRTFGKQPLSANLFATMLRVIGDPIAVFDSIEVFQNNSYHKVVASGGARHPTEIYVYANNVKGLEPGCYHYYPPRHRLDQVGPAVSRSELDHATGGQCWVSDAGIILLYVGLIARSQWKYDMGRAYRALCMDVGHLSQTVYLLCAALNQHVTFIGSFRDEDFERMFHLDPIEQALLGASVIGSPSGIPLREEAAYRLPPDFVRSADKPGRIVEAE